MTAGGVGMTEDKEREARQGAGHQEAGERAGRNPSGDSGDFF